MNDNLKKSVMEFCPPSFILAAPRYIRITSYKTDVDRKAHV